MSLSILFESMYFHMVRLSVANWEMLSLPEEKADWQSYEIDSAGESAF